MYPSLLLDYYYVSTQNQFDEIRIIIKQLDKIIIIINLTEWSKNNYKTARRKDILYIVVV